MPKKTNSTTLTVDPTQLKNGQFLDIHHEVLLDADAPGINIWTFPEGNDDGELVWAYLPDVVDNLLEFEDFEEFVIDDWIAAFKDEIKKMEAYKAKLQAKADESE